MKSVILVTTFLLFAAVAIAAEDSLELATARGCFVCHGLHYDRSAAKPLAPSYQEIAERYRGDAGAFQYLVARILHGTLYAEQNWSDAISMRFMPPNINVNRLEAGELTNWILTLPTDQALRARLVQHEFGLLLSARNGCMACHLMNSSPERRLMPLAPAFRDIARRYRDDEKARQKLVHSIVYGTRAAPKTWTQVNMEFMPPNVGLERTTAEQLVNWILTLE